ncbi:Os09g0250300, partial [Oryza sativa Japonica Group]
TFAGRSPRYRPLRPPLARSSGRPVRRLELPPSLRPPPLPPRPGDLLPRGRVVVGETEVPEIVKAAQDAWAKVEDKYAVTAIGVAALVGLWTAIGAIKATGFHFCPACLSSLESGIQALLGKIKAFSCKFRCHIGREVV